VPEIATMGRTLTHWREEIVNHHRTGASNGATEGMNFCAKQVKRAGRGFANFGHYRLRVLLYAGGVAWPTQIRPPRITSTHPNETGRAANVRSPGPDAGLGQLAEYSFPWWVANIMAVGAGSSGG
jgi:Transposase